MKTPLETLDPVVLAAKVQTLQRDQQELERKRYVDACIARFSQLMRYQDDLPLQTWAQQLMDAFAVEFETLQSALYRINETGRLLFTGGFATHNNTQHRIELGEGLVGQTAQSRRPLYLTHETGIDTHTHSSLARLQLRGLAIVPLVFNERLEGVLEMATLDPLSPEKRELLEALAQVLAANLSTIANQSKLRLLLQEAQDKSNALISQEEELRQNLEELEATQDEMRRVQQELQANSARLAQLALVAEKTDNAVIIINAKGAIQWANPGFTNMCGWHLEEVQGQKLFDSFQGPDTDPKTVQRIRENMRAGISFREEILNYHRNGQPYWVSINITPIKDANGIVQQFLTFELDITQQKHQQMELAKAFEQMQASEEELRQNAEELQATQEQLARMARDNQSQLDAINRSTAMVELNMDGELLNANEQFLRISGYTLSQVKGKPHSNLVPASMVQSEAYLAFWNGLRAGKYQEGEFERISGDGKSFWIRGSYNPILGEDGRPIKVLKFCVDITEQKRQQAQLAQAFEEMQASEEEIRQNAEELQATQEQLARMAFESKSQLEAINRSTAMVELDMSGELVNANNQFLRISGYTLAQLQGQQHHTIVPAAVVDSPQYRAFWAGLRRGEFQEGEFERIGADGKSFWIRGSYNPILNEDGKPIKVVKFCVDITQQKEQQATLAHAFEELQATEEEIRQNAEELQATQEELSRLSRDMRAQLHAIRRSTAMVELDLNGMILDANENFLLVVGYRLEEVKGKHHRLFVDEAYAKSSDYADFWRKLNFGEYVAGEFPRRTKDGRTVWIQGSYNPVFGVDGKPEKIIKYCYDITHVKQQQAQLQNAFEELQASEEEIRQSAEELNAQHEEMRRVQMELTGQNNALNNAAIVSEADVRGDITFVNDEFVRLAKYTRNELIGNNHRIVKSGHQPQEIFVDLWATISKGKVWRGELKNRAKDGSYYWVAATITPVLGVDNKPVKYIGVRFDITALKEAEARLLTEGEASETAASNPAAAVPDPELGTTLRRAAATNGKPTKAAR